MNIKIEPKAKEYIENNSNNRSITVDLKTMGTGWQISRQPSVSMGSPEDESQYETYEVEEIKVYIVPGIRTLRDRLSIKLSEFRGEEYIYLEGVRFP